MNAVALGLIVAWSGIAMGITSGVVLGLGFANAQWLGGYGSWQRRLLRLGHIAPIGLGVLTGMAALTMRHCGTTSLVIPLCWAIAVVGMPVVCALAAWRVPWRHAFVVPVMAAAIAIILVFKELLCVSL